MRSLEQFYLNKIYEGMLTQDDQMIQEYEELIKELHRQEFMTKLYIQKKKENK